MAGPVGGQPGKTLQEARFVIGDFVSCAIFPPGTVGRGIGGGEGRGRGGFGAQGVYYDGGGGGRGRGRVRIGEAGVPEGEWKRGQRVPDGGGMGRGGGYGRGLGRMY